MKDYCVADAKQGGASLEVFFTIYTLLVGNVKGLAGGTDHFTSTTPSPHPDSAQRSKEEKLANKKRAPPVECA